MKVRAVIQARMSSTRLRGKTLMPVADKALLRRVVETARKHPFIQEIIVATSNNSADDPIEAYCQYLGISCIRGDKTDVFQRYMLACAGLDEEDHLVRITADNMFCRFDATLEIFSSHINNKADYSAVEGLSHVVYEFIKVGAFNRILKQEIALNEYDREHVTPVFRKEELGFRVQAFKPTALKLKPELEKQLTVDTQADLHRIESLIEALGVDEHNIDFDQIYHWLTSHPLDS